jgi:carbamoylphosphate synthase large subunit
MDSLDYNYLRGKSIDRKRFEEALDELGIETPEYIKGWKWI